MITRALDPHWYIDPEIYRKERERIFAPSWWLLGPVEQVAQVGDYLCDRVCGWPVLVLRCKDNVLRGFLNVCRHRGASLVAEGFGSQLATIRCPYHGWLYDDHGKLVNAPRFGDAVPFEPDTLSLHSVAVHIWNDLVFVKIAKDQGVGFNEWLGEAAHLCEQFPGPADLDYYGDFSVSGELNWKAYCDNTVEGYHLNLVHPTLGNALAGGNVDIYSVNDGHSVIFDVTHGTAGAAQQSRGAKGCWIYHFPGLQLVLGEKIFKAERVESHSSEQVRSKNWAWYGGLDDEARQAAFQWGQQIVEEDFGICADVTNNMRAGIYTPGPLSPVMETHVARFQAIVKDLVLNGS